MPGVRDGAGWHGVGVTIKHSTREIFVIIEYFSLDCGGNYTNIYTHVIKLKIHTYIYTACKTDNSE